MADNSKRKGLQETGAEPRTSGLATDWSSRWPGQPDDRSIQIPHVAARRVGSLAATIEDEVIPRLLLSQRAHIHEIHSDVTPLSQAGEGCIDEFVRLLLTDELEVAYAYIDSVRVRGVTLSAVYLELLAPAARTLGEMWEDDRVSFADVTVALCRLHDVMRNLSASQPPATDTLPQGRRALLVPMPGEQHTFGLLMVTDFFRRAGWDVWNDAVANSSELVSLVRHEWFTMIGLSVGCEAHLEGVASTIHALRRAARNRSVGVMVGGSLIAKRPELAIQVGADAMGKDARQAVMQAENLVGMFARRC
jgi:MerR family transcriptional regulator, light-induced transcriptional regulator